LTAYVSSDGYSWTPIAGSTVSLNLGSALLAGLAVTSDNGAQLSAATMNNVAVSTSPPAPAPPVPCPSPWTCADIGSPIPVGSQSYDPGSNTWTINAGGSDITGTADQFHFVWQTLAGDGSISAQVVSQTNSSANAKAGVMFRASTDPGSPNYAVLVSPGAGIKVQERSTQGGTTTKLANPSGSIPAYLKVTRSGNTFAAYTSADGVTWTLIPGSTFTMSLGSTLLEGLAVTSHNSGVLGTVTMDAVSAGASAPPPPAPTVTNVSPNTGSTTGGTSVTVTGTNLTGATAVSFGRTAAAAVVVNSATSITATSPAEAAGTVDVTVTTPGGTSATTSADQFGYVASPACPSPWTCADIGSPIPVGSQSYDPGSNTWTINAGGSDITGTADQFHFVWQTLAGDGSISAQVVSQTNSSANAKAGVMFRASTDPGSPNYAVLVSPGAGIKVQERSTQGGTTTKLANPSGSIPAYLKVTRSGNTFAAYTSADGVTWTLIPGSTFTMSLGSTLLEGLAVTSHNSGVLGTVTMDAVEPS
jgi:outer membrane lipoprotein-sorting protein